MNAREELVEIIAGALIKYVKKELATAKVQTITAEIRNIREAKEGGSIEKVAQAILDAGFVRLEDAITEIKKIKEEIVEEINSRPQYSNIGKKGCVKRLDSFLTKFETKPIRAKK